MADAKDILGLSGAPPIEVGGLQKKGKVGREKKQTGISREVYALTGGHPIQTEVSLEVWKKPAEPATTTQNVKWGWIPFKSSARSDDLELYHWAKIKDGVPPVGDHAYAKYNKSLVIPRYADDEYALLLQHPQWSKAETDHLFDLCERYDLRFPVIVDRYPSDGRFSHRRTEELKDRFYSVVRTLVMAESRRAGDKGRGRESVLADWPQSMLKDGFNVDHEVERRKVLEELMAPSVVKTAEEAEILAESKRILERRKAVAQAEAQAKARAASVAQHHHFLQQQQQLQQAATVAAAATASKLASAGAMGQASSQRDDSQAASGSGSWGAGSLGPNPLHAVARSSHFAQYLDKYVAARGGPRLVKRVQQMFEEMGGFTPLVHTNRVCALMLGVRNEVMVMLDLQRKIEARRSELAALQSSTN